MTGVHEGAEGVKNLCYDIAIVQARKSMMSSWLEETGRMLGRIQNMKDVAKHRAGEMDRVYNTAYSTELILNELRTALLDAEGAYSKLLDELLAEVDELEREKDDRQARRRRILHVSLSCGPYLWDTKRGADVLRPQSGRGEASGDGRRPRVQDHHAQRRHGLQEGDDHPPILRLHGLQGHDGDGDGGPVAGDDGR